LRRVASAGFAVYQFVHTELTSQYRLEVAQGVDIALLAAIAICLDEQEKATRSSGWVPRIRDAVRVGTLTANRSYDAASGGATSSGGGAFRDPVHVDPSGGVVTEGR
jgi:hypothetical protein